jgi:putative flippase GtrA
MISSKPVKFLFAGGFGAASYVVGSYLLTAIGMEAWIASVVVYASLIPVVYYIQRRFVFESTRSHISSFPRYLMIQLFGLGLSAALPFVLGLLNIHPIISFVCVVVLITFANYALQLRWVFSR